MMPWAAHNLSFTRPPAKPGRRLGQSFIISPQSHNKFLSPVSHGSSFSSRLNIIHHRRACQVPTTTFPLSTEEREYRVSGADLCVSCLRWLWSGHLIPRMSSSFIQIQFMIVTKNLGLEGHFCPLCSSGVTQIINVIITGAGM